MKTLKIAICRIKHPFKGEMTMDQIYLTSQDQDGQHQLKLRVPVLPDDGSALRSIDPPTHRPGQQQPSASAPRLRAEAEMSFSPHTALLFLHQAFHSRPINAYKIHYIYISQNLYFNIYSICLYSAEQYF